MTVMVASELLRAAAERLRAAGVCDARAEAELLLGWVLGVGRAGLIARTFDPVTEDLGARFEGLLARRCAREPFQHLTRRQEFRGLPFQVGPEVLIPRPETEEVVQAVLDLDLAPGARVADLGTGSGCIAIALAVERPGWTIAALDVSAPALALARKNAACLGVAGRIEFRLGTMTAPPISWEGCFEAVVSNPPYIAEDAFETLEPEVRDHEPRVALVPGPTGVELYRALAPAAAAMLRPGGALVLELGHDSESGVRAACADAGFEVVEVRPDLQGIARVLVARRG
jgi:release factor glutamine methyltransferase